MLGDPGVGKTRLVLEATGSDDLKSSVIYVGNGTTFRTSELLNELLKDDNEFTAIVVVDECDRESRAEVWNKLRNRGPMIGMVTVSEPEESAENNPEDMLREPDTTIVWDRYLVGAFKTKQTNRCGSDAPF